MIEQTSEIHYYYSLLFSIKMSTLIPIYAICFTIFQVSLSDSVPRYSTNVAKPSFSHKSSHHFIVTRLPNHWKKQQPCTANQLLFVRINIHEVHDFVVQFPGELLQHFFFAMRYRINLKSQFTISNYGNCCHGISDWPDGQVREWWPWLLSVCSPLMTHLV